MGSPNGDGGEGTERWYEIHGMTDSMTTTSTTIIKLKKRGKNYQPFAWGRRSVGRGGMSAWLLLSREGGEGLLEDGKGGREDEGRGSPREERDGGRGWKGEMGPT